MHTRTIISSTTLHRTFAVDRVASQDDPCISRDQRDAWNTSELYLANISNVCRKLYRMQVKRQTLTPYFLLSQLILECRTCEESKKKATPNDVHKYYTHACMRRWVRFSANWIHFIRTSYTWIDVRFTTHTFTSPFFRPEIFECASKNNSLELYGPQTLNPHFLRVHLDCHRRRYYGYFKPSLSRINPCY